MEKFSQLAQIIYSIGIAIGFLIFLFFICVWLGALRSWFLGKLEKLNQQFPKR